MRDYKLILNLVTNEAPDSKIFKQYDTGNEIELELYQNEHLNADEKLVLTDESVLAFFKRQDGVVLQKNCTIRNGNAIVKTAKDVLGVPGILELECMVKKGDVETTTTRMTFTVKESIVRDGAIEEDPRYYADLVTELLDVRDNVKAETIGKIEEVASQLEETKMQKVDKVEGESLTPNKYTNDDKSKVDTIPTLAPKAYVDTKVATISSGTPLFASSVTEMTDTTKNYVNIADGFLYTYNGSAFIKSTVKYQEMGLSDKQVTPVKTSFIENFDNDIAKDVPVLKGYLDYSTGAFTPSENFETTDFIELEEGIKYICEFSGSNGTNTLTTPRAIIIFNNDKSFSRRLELPAGMTSGSLSAQNSNEKYVRVNMEKTNNNLKIYPISGHKIENILSNIKVPFNNIVDIPKQEATGSSFNFIGRPRKAIISFILDGEYDMNSTMELIFSNKGFRVGFAPQYVTNWSNNPITTYLEWQAKGHEILSHGTYVLNDSASYTEEEVKTIIENSYNTLVNQGFNIKGFIGSSGKVADKYLKYVRDHYEYSATEPNHSGAYNGTGAEPCLYFKTDAPYKIWRYSIQSSTLEQMKSAVDKAIETNGLLIFYGHAQSTSNDNFTTANLTALCDYILSKKCKVLTPYEAIKEYYSIRYEDLLNSL